VCEGDKLSSRAPECAIKVLAHTRICVRKYSCIYLLCAHMCCACSCEGQFVADTIVKGVCHAATHTHTHTRYIHTHSLVVTVFEDAKVHTQTHTHTHTHTHMHMHIPMHTHTHTLHTHTQFGSVSV